MSLLDKLNESFSAFSKRRDIPAYLKAPPLIASAWTFQGILNMDRTERRFKIVIDIVGTLLFSYCLSHKWDIFSSVLVGFLLMHSLNFVFNSHPFVVAKNLGLTRTPKHRIARFMEKTLMSAERNSSVREIMVIGSFARLESTDRSDIDLRVIRNDGALNGITACLWAALERSRALFARVPLDVFVLDSGTLCRLRQDETPVVLSRAFLDSLSD